MDLARFVDPVFLRGFCQRWKVERLEVFGSVARGEERPDSDLDLLVTFAPDAQWSLFDQMHMQEELEGHVGRKVDLISRRAIEKSTNPFRRELILSEASRRAPRDPMAIDRALLDDMATSAAHVMRSANGMDFPTFCGDNIAKHAIFYELTRLGRAASQVSQTTRDRYPTLPWDRMATRGEELIRDYDKIDLSAIWAVVRQEVPTIVAALPPPAEG